MDVEKRLRLSLMNPGGNSFADISEQMKSKHANCEEILRPFRSFLLRKVVILRSAERSSNFDDIKKTLSL